MIDLEQLLREGQDRLRGRPENWWERNHWTVKRWLARSSIGLLFVFMVLWSLSVAFIAQHFITKYW
jgi:hypothetical protein